MSTILTDDELPPLPARPEPDGYLTIKIIGRPVEVNAYRDSTMDEYALQARRDAVAAVLAKLERQEPVAMRYDFDGYGYKYIDSGSGSDWRSRIPDAEAVYAAPLPAPQQADRQRVPDGWKLVPVQPTQEMLKELGNAWEGVNRATWQWVLAAAPEAPVHADRQQGPEADHVVTQTCTDERPCIPCFTDNGLCAALAAAPEAPAQAEPGVFRNTLRLSLDRPNAPAQSEQAAEPVRDERAAFEAWVAQQPEGVAKQWWCRQIDDGGYSCYAPDVMWRAWQARAALNKS